MRQYFRILLAFIIIWFGYKSIRQISAGIESGLFSEFQYFYFLLLILFTASSLILDTYYFNSDKMLIQYTVSFIGVLFCLTMTYKIIQQNRIDNSKNILTISNKAGANNVMTFEFKENMKFRLTEYNRLGQVIYYGKYLKSNDSINLVAINYTGFAKHFPKNGLIKKDTMLWTNFDTMLVERK